MKQFSLGRLNKATTATTMSHWRRLRQPVAVESLSIYFPYGKKKYTTNVAGEVELDRFQVGGQSRVQVDSLISSESSFSEVVNSLAAIQRQAMVDGDLQLAIRSALELALSLTACEVAILLPIRHPDEAVQRSPESCFCRIDGSRSSGTIYGKLLPEIDCEDPRVNQLYAYCEEIASQHSNAHPSESSCIQHCEAYFLAMLLRSPAGQLVGILGLAGKIEQHDVSAITELLQPLLDLFTILIESHARQSSDIVANFAQHESDDHQARLKLALNASRLGVWEWNRDTGHVYWSPECHRLLNARSLDEKIDSLLSFLHPEDADRFLSSIERLETDDIDRIQEYRLLSEARLERWIECSFLIKPNSGTQLPTVVGTLRDVTDRKHSALQLQEVREEFKAIIDHSPVSIFVKDLDGRYTIANPQAQKVLGEGIEAIGRTDQEMLDADSALALRDHDLKVLSSDRVWEFEDTVKRDDYSRTFLAVKFPLHDLQGKPRAVCGIATDITERLQAEHKLRLAQFSVDNAAIGVLWIATDGRLKYVNDWACERLGYEKCEILSKSIFDFTEHTDSTWKARIHQLKQVGSLQFEAAHVRKDGTKYPADILAYYEQYGGEEYIFAFAQDITEKKKAEHRLEEQSTELLHASRLSMLGQMVAAMSHEVAQPLSAVGNYAAAAMNILESGDSDDLKLKEYVEAILEQNHRCGEILSRLRDFGRTGSFRQTECNLAEIIEESLRLITGELNRHETRVEKTLPDDLPLVEVDRVQIQQVIINLITNAIDAMTRTSVSQKQINVSAFAEGSRVGFSISDSGKGLEPGHLNRLWDPFYTTKQEGMGLGLSICQSIINKHSGLIEAKNNNKGGACFTVYLPKPRPQA